MTGVDIAQITVSLLVGVAAGIISGLIVRKKKKPMILVLGIAATFFIIAIVVTAYSYQSVVLSEIPYLTGLSKDEAKLRLQDRKLIPICTEQYSDTVDKGRVISQDLSPGLLVKKGSEVQFVVSKGPPPERIPDLTGRSRDEAALILEENGLIPVFTERCSDTVDKGRVISQDLSPGLLVERGSEVQVVVSKGPCPLEAYMVYSDIGIAGGDVWVWSGADWGLEPPLLVEGSYVVADAPEGTTCFAVTSGSGHDNYVGWGVFVGVFKDHKLITPHTVDLSDYENLEFLVKTSINLKVEIQQDNSEGKKSLPCLISNYGWSSSLPDIWQKVTIPKSAFRNVDLTKIFCPFMITGKGSEITFYVDEVMWIP